MRAGEIIVIDVGQSAIGRSVAAILAGSRSSAAGRTTETSAIMNAYASIKLLIRSWAVGI